MLKKILNMLAVAILQSVLLIIISSILGVAYGWIHYRWVTKAMPLTDEELDLLSDLENED